MHADGGERAHEGTVDPARVELDGVFFQARQVEVRGELRGDGFQPLRAENGGRAAAPMQMREPAAAQALQHGEFGDQALRIGVDRLALAHGAGVAAAIEAELGAERHMDIEREGRLARQRAEPLRINVGVTAAEKCGAVGYEV